MSYQTHGAVADRYASTRAQLDAFLSAFGQGFNAYLERRSRLDRIRALNAKSDAELAQMGLTRDQIPQHVFRDILYL